MYTLNYIVQQSGISRHMLLKYAKNLEITPTLKNRGQSKVYYFSAEDTKKMLNYASNLDPKLNQLNRELIAAKMMIDRLSIERDNLRTELKHTSQQLHDALIALNNTHKEEFDSNATSTSTRQIFTKYRCDRSGYLEGVALIRRKIGMVDQ